ncbi:MAG: hypothetical protein EXR72_24435 [Myxococcales bacterium]|nr:hypothetical protein [Myxococcales bacterium]
MACLILFAAGGCSPFWVARPEAPPIDALGRPPGGLGQLCVVREFWGVSAVTLVVRDNGHVVGATRGPSYFCYFAEPGRHRIVSEVSDSGRIDAPRETAVEILPGGRYYLAQTVAAGGQTIGWISEADAGKRVEKCGYQVLIRGPGNDPLPGMTPVAGAERTLR